MTSSADPPMGKTPSTRDDVPGKPLSTVSAVVDKGTALLQSFKPLNQIHQHVCTFAVHSQDLSRQIETHHYIGRVNEDFLQCLVFDSDSSDARLIGVEYIVSEKLFLGLPEEEKKLWHSHAYEIKTGLWVSPGVPEALQKQELKKLVSTYGKFWCTWQFDRGDRLPLGPPTLMLSPQQEYDIHADLVQKRDERYKISRDEKHKSRADIEEMGYQPLSPADYWRHSKKGFVVEMKEVDFVDSPPMLK